VQAGIDAVVRRATAEHRGACRERDKQQAKKVDRTMATRFLLGRGGEAWRAG
jgi:hypothetical protein